MKKILGTILGLMLMSQAFASIAVSPTRIEIDANKVKGNFITTAFEVKGDNAKAMRFKVYPEYFDIDDQAQVIMIDKCENPHNIAKKIRFVPSEFNVLPGKSQKVRVNIANIKQLPDGENRAILYIEDVQPKTVNFDTGSDKIGAQLIVKTRVGVPIYIDKGNYTRVGEIESFNINQTKDGNLEAELKILSKGNTRLRYNANIQLIKGELLVDEYSIGSGVVGQENSFVHKASVQFKKALTGTYTARAVVTYTDQNRKKQVLKKETTINIKGEM